MKKMAFIKMVWLYINGKKINIIAVRVIEDKKENEENKFKNKIKFYANSTVIPKYALLDLCNFINFCTAGGKFVPETVLINDKQRKIVFSKPFDAELNCIVYSSENYEEKDTENYSISKQGEGEYLISYKNIKHKQLSEVAKEIFNITKCSKKNVPVDKIIQDEQEAFILNSKNLETENLIDPIPEMEI